METVTDFIFLGSKIRWWPQMVTAAMKLSHLLFGRKAMTNLERVFKSRHYFIDKGLSSQSYGFCSSHVWMWELDLKKAEHQRIDAFKLWCWWSLLSPFKSKEIKPVNWKGNQPWIFIGKTDAEAEASVLGLLMQRADSLEIPWFWER